MLIQSTPVRINDCSLSWEHCASTSSTGGRFVLRSAPNRGTVAVLEMPAGPLPHRAAIDAPIEGDVR